MVPGMVFIRYRSTTDEVQFARVPSFTACLTAIIFIRCVCWHFALRTLFPCWCTCTLRPPVVDESGMEHWILTFIRTTTAIGIYIQLLCTSTLAHLRPDPGMELWILTFIRTTAVGSRRIRYIHRYSVRVLF